MKVVELTPSSLPGILFEATRVLRGGGVIAYPTDTVYGLGGNALDERVIERIFEIKGRPAEKGMIALVKDHAMARELAIIDLWSEGILERLWPGSVTVMLPKKPHVPEVLTGGAATIALRLSNHPFVEALMRNLDFPLVSTSANASGIPNEPSLGAFLEYLEHHSAKPDLVIDAGALPEAIQSTLIDLTQKPHPVVLRRGKVSKEELENTFRQML